MRKSEFRAWDTVTKKMTYKKIYDLHMGVSFDGDAVAYERSDDSYGCEVNVYANRFNLMQYTGLKDKHSVKIFEGDILRTSQNDEYMPIRDSGGGIVDYDTVQGFAQIGVVGFKSCSFSYTTHKTLAGRHEEIKIPIDWLEEYEIVGNIYENPELLNID